MQNLMRGLFAGRFSVLPRVFGTVLILVMSSGLASAQQDVGMVATIGSGKLAINGGGFRPYEHVALVVEGEQGSQFESMDADSQGNFRLQSRTALEPGANVQVTATGNHGTVRTVNVEVPDQLLPLGTPLNSVLLALIAGFAMLASGVAAMTRPQRA